MERATRFGLSALSPGATLLALLSAAAGLALAAHYPLLRPAFAIALWLAAAALAAWGWTRTPLLLLGTLPLIGLAPWSGWITFEELDLLVFACAAGGYAALAVQPLLASAPARVPVWRRALSFSPLALLLMGLFGASLLLALQRGFADAGGFAFGWFQGYHEPMNSLRLSKSFFLVALLLPLWVQVGMRRPHALGSALLWGMVAALVGTSLAVLAERQAFTGLLNFSSDYRSTALFWEMHVGGAALDGCLAMTVPFAVLALLRERSPWRFALLMGLCLAAAYAVLTTFSRGLYAAVPVSLGALVLLRDAQRRRAVRLSGASVQALLLPVPLPRWSKVGALLMLAVFVLAAVLMFGGGAGYRGLLALLGAMTILLALPASLWLPSPGQRVTALLMGTLLAAVLTGAGWLVSEAVPKAAYAGYTLAFAVAAWLRAQDKPGQAQPVYACLLTGSWFWLLGSMVVVADHWGGDLARLNALLAATALGLLWALLWLCPVLWPFHRRVGGSEPAWRSRSLLLVAMVLASAVVASLGGGAFLRDRVASWQGDLQVRLAHWKEGLALLETPTQVLLGKGAGRFVASHFFAGPITQHTGDYRLNTDADGTTYLVLTGGKHMLGYGELFRVSQRIDVPQGEVRLTLRARATRDVTLQAEVCEKQLLYIDNCQEKAVTLKAQAQAGGREWQAVELPLGAARATGGSWYAPRFVTFSVAVGTTGGKLEITDLQLSDGRSRALLANGDFAGEMAHWFFSSDRYHLPWHIKNLPLHLLFDQGLLGLLLFGALLLVAMLRLCFGRGREHVLAPALAASLIGFVAVGLFDSLIDAPRMAIMFYAVLLVSLGLRALPGAVGAVAAVGAVGAVGAEPSK